VEPDYDCKLDLSTQAFKKSTGKWFRDFINGTIKVFIACQVAIIKGIINKFFWFELKVV
jgi:hypothetical protein